jgi:P4 family phage/plasmid primase-like protien
VNADLSAFLERFRPDGYTTFVGIVPEGSAVAATFNGADASKAANWIESQNRARGVYFTANSTPADLRQKPTKSDIVGIASLWGDVDPLDGNGRAWTAERERLLALAGELAALDCSPSFIVDSGNGIQPVWLLANPIESSPEYRAAAEALCARIEAALGAKGTHNVDRLLRVPGTRNLPNAKKRKLGRSETQACLLHATWQRYSWSDLEELATRLEGEPPEHAEPVEPGSRAGTANASDLDLPSEPPDPLDNARLEALRASHPDVFDLAHYDGDQSRQDLALASLARRAGWPPVDAWRLLIAVRGDRKACRRDYIERTLALAYAGQAGADTVEAAGDTLFDLSHDGLALDMGRRWQQQARHVALWGKWLFWTGSRWEVDERLIHMAQCRVYLRARADSLVRAAARGEIEDFDVDKAEVLAKTLRSAPMVANVTGLARSNPEMMATVEQWDADPWLLGTPGGVVDLRTGKVRPAKIEDYITKTTAVAPAPPEAGSPLWENFLDRIAGGNVELQGYLQRFAGYSSTGSIQEHAFAFGYGTGANGKSVFINTLAWLLGDYAQTIPTEMLMVSNTDRHPTELARLRGVRLAIGSETEDGKRWAESKIKSLTGGDRIPARYMRQDFFEFDPQFKLFLIGNYKPALRGVDEAMRRRLHFVPFTVTIPPAERDPELPEKLRAEGAAILRWMIDGCLEWQRQGLNPPEIVRAATADYLTSEDAFGRWRDECAEPDPHAWESSGDLWSSWKRWAEHTGEFVGNQRKFSESLLLHGLSPERQPGTGARGYRGLRLLRPDYTSDSRYGFN